MFQSLKQELNNESMLPFMFFVQYFCFEEVDSFNLFNLSRQVLIPLSVDKV